VSTPKILSVCTSDVFGGAARAAYRIHQSLKMLGVDSHMFVKDKGSQDSDVIPLASFVPQNSFYKTFDLVRTKISNKISHYRWNRYPNRDKVFMSDLRATDIHGALQKLDYDVLHLHWINQRFISLDKLPKDRPIVWTLHDSWPFCGVCHYFNDCTRYQTACGNCPYLHSSDENDLSHQIWSKKFLAYKDLDLHIVTPSRWLGDCAKKSSLLGRFPVTVIPNGLDTNTYKPIKKQDLSPKWSKLREQTAGKKIILYGAVAATTDMVKGFDKLLSALQYLEKSGRVDDIQLVVFGADEAELKMDLNIPIHYVGYVSETEELVSLYNMADVMVVPSLSETFGQTASEALSCGIPVVAFRCTGLVDIVDHKINGYLANPYNPEDLAEGIRWCLDKNADNRLGNFGRKKVLEKFAPEVVGKQYLDLYISAYENALTKRKS